MKLPAGCGYNGITVRAGIFVAHGKTEGKVQGHLDDQILPVNQRHQVEIFPHTLAKPLDLADIFGNDAPVELEVGIGKGLFLEHSARQNPHKNYMGIDYARKYFRRARERIEKRPIYNVRLVLTEALTFFQESLPENSISVVHVYYPDPWPKKRHHKRRLFRVEFVEMVARVLVPGGTLFVATDHEDYWEWISDVLEKQNFLQKSNLLPEPPEGLKGLTSFQIKYFKEGRSIFRIGYTKQS